MAKGNQQDAQDYNYSMNLDKDSINPEDRESIPAQKKARGRHARAAVRYGRISRGEPAFKKSPNDEPVSKWTNEDFQLDEKSVSQAQQKLMGMAYALKKGEMEEKDASPEVKKLADSMSLKDLKDFASTKHDEIPAKKEEVNEAIRSKNEYGGYRNEVGSDAEYAKTHTMLKKLLGQDDLTIRDYMDSTSGRHLAGLEGDTAYIKKDFKRFMKKYDPSFFKESVEVDARKKSFREALKRIEAYKAKRSMKTEGKEEYEKFFKGAMKKFGITDLGDLEGKKEKEFYDYVDANWKAKDESTIEKVRRIVNEKRKQRAMAMNEVDEPSSQNDKDIVNFHKRNTKVKSDIE